MEYNIFRVKGSGASSGPQRFEAEKVSKPCSFEDKNKSTKLEYQPQIFKKFKTKTKIASRFQNFRDKNGKIKKRFSSSRPTVSYLYRSSSTGCKPFNENRKSSGFPSYFYATFKGSCNFSTTVTDFLLFGKAPSRLRVQPLLIPDSLVL